MQFYLMPSLIESSWILTSVFTFTPLQFVILVEVYFKILISHIYVVGKEKKRENLIVFQIFIDNLL